MCARDDEAEQYLTDALARHERLEAPFFRARTMLELARLIRAREPKRAHALDDPPRSSPATGIV